MKRNHWVCQGVVLAPGGGAPPAPLRKPTYPARETLARSVCQGPLLRSHTPPAGGLSRKQFGLARTGELQQKERLMTSRRAAHNADSQSAGEEVNIA
jgi:hypothetical protein